MIAQRILRGATLMAMRQRVIADDSVLEIYASAPKFTLPNEALINTTIQLPDGPAGMVMPQGNPQQVASTDADNAIAVHGYLATLTRTQAADPRLWVTLAHTTFWTYTRDRWGAQDRAKLRKSVLEHWFVPEAGGRGALRRQAISRLWWAAHLTCAPWERDPELEVFRSADRYRFTRILLKSQQIYFDLIERNFGSDLRLRICILDALDRHLPGVAQKDGLSNESSKQFNLLLKHRLVASLGLSTLRAICEETIASVAERLTSRARSRSDDDDVAP